MDSGNLQTVKEIVGHIMMQQEIVDESCGALVDFDNKHGKTTDEMVERYEAQLTEKESMITVQDNKHRKVTDEMIKGYEKKMAEMNKELADMKILIVERERVNKEQAEVITAYRKMEKHGVLNHGKDLDWEVL